MIQGVVLGFRCKFILSAVEGHFVHRSAILFNKFSRSRRVHREKEYRKTQRSLRLCVISLNIHQNFSCNPIPIIDFT
jgi:hypothetical protein